MHHDTMTIDDHQLAEACKALAHPARIRILRHLLQETECVCGRIVDIMPLAQSTVSQHLKILKKAGLVRGQIDGPKTCYCVNRDMFDRLGRELQALFETTTREDHP